LNFENLEKTERIKLSRIMQDIALEHQRSLEDLNRRRRDSLSDIRFSGASLKDMLQSGHNYVLEEIKLKREFETAQKQALADFQQSLNLLAPTIPIKSAYDIMVEEASNVVIAQEADIEL
jgi:hypothetical protein